MTQTTQQTLDYSSLSLEEITKKQNEVQLDIANIKGQIEAAKVKYQEEGIPANHGWLTKAKAALRYKGFEDQTLNRARTKIKKQMHEESERKRLEDHHRRQSTVERCFIDKTKEYLGDEMFFKIMAEAQTLSEQRLCDK